MPPPGFTRYDFGHNLHTSTPMGAGLICQREMGTGKEESAGARISTGGASRCLLLSRNPPRSWSRRWVAVFPAGGGLLPRPRKIAAPSGNLRGQFGVY